MPKTEAFDRYPDIYDEWFEKNEDLFAAELKAVRSCIPPGEVMGLEVGVGTGRFSAPLGIKIGIEPAEKMAAKAVERGIKVFRGIAEYLPLADAVFDFILMVTTICFLDDIERSFREAFRVLKYNGSIVAAFIDRESELGKRYEAKKARSLFYNNATFFSVQEVLGHLTQAGFQNFKIRQTLSTDVKCRRVESGFGKGSFVVIKGVKAR